jgi:cell division protease FtsH
MSNSNKEDRDEPVSARGQNKGASWLWLLLFFGMAATLYSVLNSDTGSVGYDVFEAELDKQNIQVIRVRDDSADGFFKSAPERGIEYDAKGVPIKRKAGDDGRRETYDRRFYVQLPTDTQSRSKLLEKFKSIKEKDPEFSYTVVPGSVTNQVYMLIYLGLGVATIALLWSMLRRSREQMMGGGFLSGFTRSTAKRYEKSNQPITFSDVAGLEGVKADLQEIVEFLKSPEKFQKLGGRVPKGVLLNGPPGTGKTLLARAVAGEAGVAFFSVNGSEFIQMFVGVGASRVRDLFQQAKESSPAIIFIDEIDAVGRQRGAGLGGGHDEREQTLNQILSEMDGFSPTDSVIVIAATNRPDVLDPALLRPGRFDRHVTVGRPTMKGRIDIFKVHVRDVPMGDDVDIARLAESTVGMTGADIRNVVNEAALWAARHDKSVVNMDDFDYARDKVLMGAKREEVMLPEELEKTAYHEAGHTLAAWFLPGAQRVYKVTIIPRGQSLGSTQIVPSEDKMNLAEGEIRDQLIVLLGGRAAEKVVYDETSAGAENDLERATKMARRMVGYWGMSEKLGPVSYKTTAEDPFLGREIHQQRQFSEQTQELIDSEVADILRSAESKAVDLLVEKRHELEKLKDALLEQEELDEKEIGALIGPSVHAQRKGLAVPAAEEHPVASV